jgi:hypothetical protein
MHDSEGGRVGAKGRARAKERREKDSGMWGSFRVINGKQRGDLIYPLVLYGGTTRSYKYV